MIESCNHIHNLLNLAHREIFMRNVCDVVLPAFMPAIFSLCVHKQRHIGSIIYYDEMLVVVGVELVLNEANTT